MKSAEARDAMVKRVNDTAKKYPRFQDLPETAGGDFSFEIAPGKQAYVEGLYKVCYEGEVLGRNGGMIVGKYL